MSNATRYGLLITMLLEAIRWQLVQDLLFMFSETSFKVTTCVLPIHMYSLHSLLIIRQFIRKPLLAIFRVKMRKRPEIDFLVKVFAECFNCSTFLET